MSLDERLRERLDAARLLAIPVRELDARERPILLRHLIGLEPADRYLRFGNPLGDSIIRQYVAGIDFEHDTVFGVFDERLNLSAAGHFAILSTDDHPMGSNERCAEFGLSVAADARGQGLGTALFVRASTHARNLGIDALFMHCLMQNQAMVRIARKAGMKISVTAGEARAYLELEPADVASVMREAVQKQIALFDYEIKRRGMERNSERSSAAVD